VEIFRSYVKQLAVHHSRDRVHQSVLTLYKKKESSGFASQELTLDEAETLLHELITAIQQVTFVLDALDECHEKERSLVIDIFNRLVSSFPKVQLKIFISSRRNVDIQRQLQKEANIGIEATENQDDIFKYVMDRIGKDHERRERQHMQSISDELRTEIAQVLLEKSGGM
jgi:hypothetical protein